MGIPMPSAEAMARLVGLRFPGGTYRIEHWENFLFTEATGAESLGDGIAHPAHLFHVAINGVGTSITQIFELVGSVGAPVSIDYYDWQLHRPLREDVTYVLQGGITDHARSVREGAPTRDSFVYEIAISDESGAPVADVAFRWHHWRPAGEGSA